MTKQLQNNGEASEALPVKSRWLYDGFVRYSRWYLRRHFNALRLAAPGFPESLRDEPVLVYLNHPSWWDPLVGLMLAEIGFGDRSHYAPINARALQQYGFFARLGFFGIDVTRPSGGARFLRLGQRIMTEPGAALWVTAEGQFTDPRQRPIRLQSGVAHLARRLSRGVVLPLAVEYPFWQEKRPEALCCFGEPMWIGSLPASTTRQWQERLSDSLERTMNRLSTMAIQQNPADWQTLLAGRSGISVTYDLWRGMRARLTGQRFYRTHREATRYG